MKKSTIISISMLGVAATAVAGIVVGARDLGQNEIKASIVQGEDTIVISNSSFDAGKDISGKADVESTNGKTYEFGYGHLKTSSDGTDTGCYGYVMLLGTKETSKAGRGFIYNAHDMGNISKVVYVESGGGSPSSYKSVTWSSTVENSVIDTDDTNGTKFSQNATVTKTDDTNKGFINLSTGQKTTDTGSRNGQFVSITITFTDDADALAAYVMAEETSGQCTSKFPIAKNRYLGLTDTERTSFQSNAAHTRYEAWANSLGKAPYAA